MSDIEEQNFGTMNETSTEEINNLLIFKYRTHNQVPSTTRSSKLRGFTTYLELKRARYLSARRSFQIRRQLEEDTEKIEQHTGLDTEDARKLLDKFGTLELAMENSLSRFYPRIIEFIMEVTKCNSMTANEAWKEFPHIDRAINAVIYQAQLRIATENHKFLETAARTRRGEGTDEAARGYADKPTSERTRRCNKTATADTIKAQSATTIETRKDTINPVRKRKIGEEGAGIQSP